VDLVLFSGDKLLGGPQAGLAAGRRALVDQLEAHPLARALRLDKLSVAALAATLRLYRPPSDPFQRIPVLRLLAQHAETLTARAKDLRARVEGLADLKAEIVETEGYAGGGALPMRALPGRALALSCRRLSAEDLAFRLRTGSVRVLGRIEQDRVLIDLRTVDDAEVPALAEAISAAAAGEMSDLSRRYPEVPPYLV
jgi:L-seryl-tRNA(Ser) seleniumtransferase